ncbi:DUF4440 domain-containing protein [Mammaliicoccus stepanovicii]|uniref:Uncharacterized protein conserved in bacteria n=1 Tax=Mammaliicoccus stepanovicii TaxID=643214 RepID=A0A239YUS2_9STAP|nr:DUF4440 domain-containing protein [Mammaliicoccus stepanovicii]PNZ75581.1 DUF4440 domain-containing protein [Mammaliicoccus stepanovicii]GGI40667.1 hypothetical protein GCM10010896_09520 [Mammaliicoccus stepanovicii]CPN52799.1 Uncharacterized protein conserved in bacteria [Staphylococcus aureus]SNV62685.1 Uncharacterized protein conserved in bacteria [Mammaliicoccus stepanovicii]
MKKQFYELECFHLEANNRTDKQRVLDILDDDFKEIGKSGRVITKQDIKESTLHTFDFDILDFEASKIQKGVVLITYQLINKSDDIVTNRSSLWVRRSASWKMRFHQGTIV